MRAEGERVAQDFTRQAALLLHKRVKVLEEALVWLTAQVANEDGIPHAVLPAFENARGVLAAQSESKGWKNSQPVFGKYAAPQPPLARDAEWPDLPQEC